PPAVPSRGAAPPVPRAVLSRGDEPPDPPAVQTTRLAPTGPGPAMTVATAPGSSARTAAATSPSSGNDCWLAGSTKISMMPPQVRPTANASSSLTPYRCSTGRPLALTSFASSYTAPSTQPPETLPTTSPPAATAIAAPGSRGGLLNVRTTVARPNVPPASHHLETGSRMSRTIVPSAARDMTSGYVPGPPGRDPTSRRRPSRPQEPGRSLTSLIRLA